MEQSQNSNGSLRMRYGKVVIEIASRHLLSILLVLGIFGIIGATYYVQWSLVQNAIAAHVSIQNKQAILGEEHRLLQDSIREELQVITYLLSLPEARRPVLAMPSSLRQRLLPEP